MIRWFSSKTRAPKITRLKRPSSGDHASAASSKRTASPGNTRSSEARSSPVNGPRDTGPRRIRTTNAAAKTTAATTSAIPTRPARPKCRVEILIAFKGRLPRSRARHSPDAWQWPVVRPLRPRALRLIAYRLWLVTAITRVSSSTSGETDGKRPRVRRSGAQVQTYDRQPWRDFDGFPQGQTVHLVFLPEGRYFWLYEGGFGLLRSQEKNRHGRCC